MRIQISLLSLGALLIAAGCPGSSNHSETVATNVPESIKETTRATNGFAWDLYGRLRSTEGNLVLSPYSIATALTMTYAGAGGQTAQEMAQTLRFKNASTVHQGFADLSRALAEQVSPKCTILMANRLWVYQNFALRDTFLDSVTRHYGAGIQQLDFAADTEAARRAINAWVEQTTQGKIVELLKPGIVHPLTRLVLTNAIHFKGTWARQFNANTTADAPFKLEAGAQTKIPMMFQESRFRYFEDDVCQILSLPYDGGCLEMALLLPKASRESFEQRLTDETFSQYLEKGEVCTVRVYLPRFSVSAHYSLAKTMAEMGMPSAFDPKRADFSGMTGHRDLYIDAIEHEACVDVSEEGTEAAAATAVAVRTKSAPMNAPPITFRADHPFVFVIRDIPSGAILFIGRVSDPRAVH